jgi:hypothetical protein
VILGIVEQGGIIVIGRREFLRTAAALSAVPLAGRVTFAKAREQRAVPEAVVFDSRHLEGREFATHAGLLGAPVRAIEGDITSLWQNELLRRWKTGPVAIAGLTERPALFLLERLAWDHGLRVIFAAEHEPHGRGHAAHRVAFTADPRLALHLAAAGRSWPRVLAEVLIIGTRAPPRDFRPTDAALAAYIGEPSKLFSWIIAPRAAAEVEI